MQIQSGRTVPLRRGKLLTSQGIPEGRGRKTSEGGRSGIFSGSTPDERSPPAAKISKL